MKYLTVSYERTDPNHRKNFVFFYKGMGMMLNIESYVYIYNIFINPVVYLFNLSFKHGFVPNNYKCAKILQIFKSGRNDSFENYRPSY